MLCGARTVAPLQPGRPRSLQLPAPPRDLRVGQRLCWCQTHICLLWLGPELPRPHPQPGREPWPSGHLQALSALWKILGPLKRTPCSVLGKSLGGKGSGAKAAGNTKVSRPAQRCVLSEAATFRALPPGTLAPHPAGSLPEPASLESLLLRPAPAAPPPPLLSSPHSSRLWVTYGERTPPGSCCQPCPGGQRHLLALRGPTA